MYYFVSLCQYERHDDTMTTLSHLWTVGLGKQQRNNNVNNQTASL